MKDKLVENQILECQNTLRNLVASRNAIAGMKILQGNIEEAAAYYKQTLEDCKKYLEGDEIHTDLVQLIHCNFNLLCCEKWRPGLLDVSFVNEIRATMNQEINVFLEKSKSNLDKAIANLATHTLPENLIDDAFYLMHFVSMNLDKAVAMNLEDSTFPQGNRDVFSVFKFSDTMQDWNSNDRFIAAFKKSLQVSFYSPFSQ